METLSQTIRRTINQGSPLYNEGKQRECFDLYLKTAKLVVSQELTAKSSVGELLSQAVDEAAELEKEEKYGEGAWVLRHCFDDILSKKSRRALRLSGGNNDFQGWQDERTPNTSDFEKGQALSDVAYILRASLNPNKHTR